GLAGRAWRGLGCTTAWGEVRVRLGLFLHFDPPATRRKRAADMAHWGRAGARSGARPDWVWPQLRTSTVTRALLLLSLLSPTCCWSSTDRFSRCVPLPR